MHVKGAKFSVGDLHFSQGDGEISFCGAIEMAGVITLKFSVMKGGVKELAMKSPIYIPGPVEPSFGPGRYIYFEGFSVDEVCMIVFVYEVERGEEMSADDIYRTENSISSMRRWRIDRRVLG